jgi:hypothetical protein
VDQELVDALIQIKTRKKSVEEVLILRLYANREIRMLRLDPGRKRRLKWM